MAIKKLLITGFEPFGGEKINPSWEAVSRLPSELNGFSVTKLLIPVVFEKAAITVIEAAGDFYDTIVCVGQAGGRRAITPELVGINLRHATIPDNNGNKPSDEPIDPLGDNAYFSTLPVRKIADRINAAGVPSQVSYSAGTYVCNDVLYTLLSHYKNTKTKVGFIHIPYCKEQGKEPSVELSDVIKGLTVAVECLEE